MVSKISMKPSADAGRCGNLAPWHRWPLLTTQIVLALLVWCPVSCTKPGKQVSPAQSDPAEIVEQFSTQLFTLRGTTPAEWKEMKHLLSTLAAGREEFVQEFERLWRQQNLQWRKIWRRTSYQYGGGDKGDPGLYDIFCVYGGWHDGRWKSPQFACVMAVKWRVGSGGEGDPYVPRLQAMAGAEWGESSLPLGLAGVFVTAETEAGLEIRLDLEFFPHTDEQGVRLEYQALGTPRIDLRFDGDHFRWVALRDAKGKYALHQLQEPYDGIKTWSHAQ